MFIILVDFKIKLAGSEIPVSHKFKVNKKYLADAMNEVYSHKTSILYINKASKICHYTHPIKVALKKAYSLNINIYKKK